VRPPKVAVIRAVPSGPTDVTTPAALTVATRVSPEVKLAIVPPIARPLASTTVAVSARVSPCETTGTFGVITMLAGTRGPWSPPQETSRAASSSDERRVRQPKEGMTGPERDVGMVPESFPPASAPGDRPIYGRYCSAFGSILRIQSPVLISGT